MGPCPDLPSLNSAFGKGYMDGNHLHSMSSKFIDGCATSPDVDTVIENLVTELCDANGVIQNRELSFKDSCCLPASGLMQLDTEPDMFGNDHGDEEGRSFLNCDWGNIADFDDLDRIFSTPVLVSLLGYVAATRDPIIGGSLLLTYTTGYVAPLLIAASFAGALQSLLSFRKYSAWINPVRYGL
ncbi:hypothetical protein Taro_052313 [Colocasia esculenta]|uniref:Uncharacterized protein n=1 Tax=Colocasia esculenta TaxID=4460 RepID=A0A843XJC6_COLES|nr:hypothetical protein [Colocasia esculenta]